jgi:hypothetical protein
VVVVVVGVGAAVAAAVVVVVVPAAASLHRWTFHTYIDIQISHAADVDLGIPLFLC